MVYCEILINSFIGVSRLDLNGLRLAINCSEMDLEYKTFYSQTTVGIFFENVNRFLKLSSSQMKCW